MTDRSFVIVGGGLAGAKAAEALREQGFDGPVVLIGEEPHRPYERPPLSKDYLAGKADLDVVFVHPDSWYADNDIDLRLNTRVTGIDRTERAVTLSDGSRVEFAKLLLATGSSPRSLPVPGGTAEGVHYLRRIPDSQRIKETIASVSHLVVIGGGWIGLEVAAAAREAETDVTLVEALALPLVRVLGAEVAQTFADLHAEHGVSLRLGTGVEQITTAGGRATGVRLADGTEIPADAVVVGVGITPNTQLADAAGLHVDDGVAVDAALRSSDPDIFAAGDVASTYHPFFGRRIRVEHWANALNQPATAAAAMLGREASYEELPYFYTDQYDLGMEYHGLAEPGSFDRVVIRGDGPGREFIAFWLREGRVLAGMNVNVWDVGESIKTLIRSDTPVDPDRLADVDVPLEQLT